MYIKWIECEVNEDQKEKFSDAQEKWDETKEADGFIAQAGGWNLKNENEACIISFWESEKYLDSFMKILHDKIFNSNKQAETYNKISINYFNEVLSMEGETGLLKAAVKNSELLRTADCYVKQDNTNHFEKVQREVWLPGVHDSEGMLGGMFSRDNKNNFRYFVSTFWDSIINHTKYTQDNLPDLKLKAGVDGDTTKVIGRNILLVDSWRVSKD